MLHKRSETSAGASSASDTAREYHAQAIHLTRTMQVNTLSLSQMADQKASILIGATFVVFSLSITRTLSSEITASTVALAATAFVSSLFAVLAVLPSTGRLPSDPAAINPLFFGHYAELEEEVWTHDMLDRLADDERLFRTMLHDAYQHGGMLYRRKYRYLAYAYRAFIGGVAVTMTIYAGEWAGAI